MRTRDGWPLDAEEPIGIVASVGLMLAGIALMAAALIIIMRM